MRRRTAVGQSVTSRPRTDRELPLRPQPVAERLAFHLRCTVVTPQEHF